MNASLSSFALLSACLGALHHSSNTPQPDLQCPELYKQPREGMLFMSHTELALCPGHCASNFLREKSNRTKSSQLYPRASQHPLCLCCSQGGSAGAAVCCSQELSVSDTGWRKLPLPAVTATVSLSPGQEHPGAATSQGCSGSVGSNPSIPASSRWDMLRSAQLLTFCRCLVAGS